jgi:hypothetical protein
MKDGGPAFPLNVNNREGGWYSEGMSIRDWFAGQALMGLCSRGTVSEGTVAQCYLVAQWMLAERDKGKGA